MTSHVFCAGHILTMAERPFIIPWGFMTDPRIYRQAGRWIDVPVLRTFEQQYVYNLAYNTITHTAKEHHAYVLVNIVLDRYSHRRRSSLSTITIVSNLGSTARLRHRPLRRKDFRRRFSENHYCRRRRPATRYWSTTVGDRLERCSRPPCSDVFGGTASVFAA